MPSFPTDFDLNSRRGGARGVTLARSQVGQWWWCLSSGETAVACALQGVDATVGAESADHQAKRWGFNLLLPPVAPAFRRKGVAHIHDLSLGQAGSGLIRQEGVLLPDVFDSNWSEAVEQCFNGVEPIAGLVGWTSDMEWRWGGWALADQPLSRASLLQVCLSLDPAFRAYHSAWDFVLARHGGEVAQVAAAWKVDLPGRGAPRQMTREEQIIDSPGYRDDLAAFVQEFAQRYLSVIRAAAHAINPDCLLLSPLLTASTPPPVRELAASHCDLLQVSELGLIEQDAPQLWQVSQWAEPVAGVDVASGLGPYECRISDGREMVVAGLRDPRVVGYGWSRFHRGDLMVDDPFDVGLVDENGRTNDALVQPLSSINTVARELRVAAADAARA